jgi:hypothetical protein
MDDLDVIAELARLAPVPPERDLPPGMRAIALAQTQSESSPLAATEQRFGRRSRRRRWVAMTLIPAALVAAAATYAATRSADDVADGVGCYAEPRLDADTLVTSSDGRDPVTICSEKWASLTVTSPPPMVACSMGSGVGVFPSDDPGLCARLGLEPLPAGYISAAQKFSSMRDDMIRRIVQERCVAESEGERIARSVLDQHGFSDWTIRLLIEQPHQTCAELGFDTVEREVHLVFSQPPT